jgi:O-glycosyl hydrolase
VSGCADGNPSGGDNLKADYFDDFADYLTEVVKHFRDSLGITFRTLEPFNEPSAGWWKGSNNQEGCNFKSNQPKMVKLLGKSLVAKGLFPETSVSAADENAIDAAVSGIKSYDDSALSYVSQINTHGYAGRSTANFTAFANLAASKKKIPWMSESGPLNGTGTQDIAMFMAQNIIQDLKLMKVSAWIDWQSYAGGGTWETIKVDKTGMTIIPSKRCYMQAAFGRFLRPGSQLIQANDSNTLAALVPRTGNLAIVIRNGLSKSVDYTVDLSKVSRLPAAVHAFQYLVSDYKKLSKLSDITIANKQFTLSAPAQSITSCVVPGAADTGVTAINPVMKNPPARPLAPKGGRLIAAGILAKAMVTPPANATVLEVFDLQGKKKLRVSAKCGKASDLGTAISALRSSGMYYVKYGP